MSCHKPGRVVARVSPSPRACGEERGWGRAGSAVQVAPRPQLLGPSGG